MARRAPLSRLELGIMEALWTRGACSVREIHESLPEKGRAAFTTVQTMVYRLEKKNALRCVKRISNANIFEAVISRDEAHTKLVDNLLALFDGRPKPVMARR
jgi:predicted transcriptional regulator